MIGTVLARYRVIAALGEGGMGEVWRAEDEKLGREVALKMLPKAFAEDPERMARFEREARVLASLNHPNIAHLYGLETAGVTPGDGRENSEFGIRNSELPATVSPEAEASAGGNSKLKTQNSELTSGAAASEVTFLVMELVEGEDLSERILRGPIPVEEATAIALQIAEALEAAHESGIVHRDLKPANIKLRPDGTVKVLDFGLAKAWETEGPDPGLSMSPTLTARHTAAGLILGTAAYMAPEQAAGVAVDRRADIWSFGVVLWEMLTGERLFDGETVSHVLASVLKDEVDLDELPPETPTYLKKLIGRCLRKKPKQRLQAIGDARIVLEEGEEDAPAARAAEAEVPGQSRTGWTAAGVAAVAAAVLGVLLLGRPEPEERVIRFEAPPPPGTRFHLAPDNPGPVVVSPDGSMLAFCSRSENGTVQLWVRALDEAEARPLSGTEGAQYPFWSPDSRRLGFFANGKLRAVEAVGGPPLALCDASEGKGGSWSSEGVIVFSPAYNTPLYRVPEAGGEAAPVTEFDSDRKDNSHRHPRFLPDSNHFLYIARSASGSSEGQAVMIGSLDGSESRLLFRAPAAVEYASGHLLFIRERTLMARAFDATRLDFTGEAFPIAESVTLLPTGTVVGVFSASQNGVLAYQAGGADQGSYRLVWRDREGAELAVVGEPGGIDEVHLIPGGELAAVALEDSTAGSGDVWLVDLRRNLFSRFTFEPGYEYGVSPTPDGKALFFSLQKDGVYALLRKEIGGSGEGQVLYESTTEMYPSSVSPDGKILCLFKGGETSGYDLWVLPLSGDGEVSPFLATDFNETLGMFSPDGRWLAYVSDESGSPQIYVTAFPERGRKWQISTGGGQAPRWSPNGTEIIYSAPDGMLTAVRVELRDGGLLIGETTALFNASLQPAGSHYWDVAPDGDRFLEMETVTTLETPNLSVVVNWLDARAGQ
jgi:serine/threonine protein kinase/Tol biopolymer transport system component